MAHAEQPNKHCRTSSLEKSRRSTAQERILFVRLSHLGDVIHALPVWHAVAESFPDAVLSFATQPAYAPLLTGLPHLDRIVTFDRSGGPGAWWRYWQEVRRFRPTWTIDCHGNWKGAVATLLSGAERRSGLAPCDWREPGARHLLNDLAPNRVQTAQAPHAVDRQLSLARHLTDSNAKTDFDLGLTQSEVAQGRRSLARSIATSGASAPHRSPLLIHLAATGDPRSWPAASFFELARLASQNGQAVILLGGPNESDLAASAKHLARTPGIHAEINTLELRPLAAWFAAAAQAGATLVACDSGPAHLAAAVDLQVHLLFGPQDPNRTGPWPSTHIRSNPHTSQSAAIELDCRPCLSRTCTNDRGPVCLVSLAPGEVYQALQARIAQPVHS